MVFVKLHCFEAAWSPEPNPTLVVFPVTVAKSLVGSLRETIPLNLLPIKVEGKVVHHGGWHMMPIASMVPGVCG